MYVYQVDPLRDEGIDYAQRLAHAEVPTELALYSGTFHASPLVPDAASSTRILPATWPHYPEVLTKRATTVSVYDDARSALDLVRGVTVKKAISVQDEPRVTNPHRR